MAADLHLIVCETRRQKTFMRAQQRERCASYDDGKEYTGWMEFKLNGKWYHEDQYFAMQHDDNGPTPEAVRDRKVPKRFSWKDMMSAPNMWVGRMSFMKASFTDDYERYVPELIMAVSEVFERRALTMINDALIAEVEAAIAGAKPNEHYKTVEASAVIEFLKKHKCKRAVATSM